MLGSVLSARYRLDGELGRGGMGVVYRAHDLSLNRPVAIKVLPASFAADPIAVQRFQNEIHHVAKLNHPHIVQIFDHGHEGDLHYYVMELVDGTDLRTLLNEKGRLTLDQTITIALQIADALDYAHGKALVHRDIKPGNILLDTAGRVRIVDFGIAKATDISNLTAQAIGTPKYMSPEQVKGQPVDGRSDQYALGILVYEMLTGHPPFDDAENSWTILLKHIEAPVPDPRATQSELPVTVVACLQIALAKDADERFDSCRAMIEGLRPPATMLTHTRTGQHRGRSRHPWRANRLFLFVLLAAILVTLLIIGNSLRQRASQSAQRPAVMPQLMAPNPPKGKLLAWYWNGQHAEQIWSITADGSIVEPLAPRTRVIAPRWSFDGQRLVYTGPDYQIYTMRNDGSENRRLTNDTSRFMGQAAFSFNDKKIVYASGDSFDAYDHIVVMNADGSQPCTVYQAPEGSLVGVPYFTPDGRILFTQFLEEKADLYLIRQNGKGLTRLTPGDGKSYANGECSINGKIAFVFSDGQSEHSDLYLTSLDHTTPVCVARAPEQWAYLGPRFSPDGTKLVFSMRRLPTDQPEEWDIGIIDIDGNNFIKLSDTKLGCWVTSWR